MKERRRDYFLMAGVFRTVYLKYRAEPELTKGQLLSEVINEFMTMLKRDNPRFSHAKFISYIKEGRC